MAVFGTGGFFQFGYDNSLKTASVLATGSDYKTVDGVLDFGILSEVGFEFTLTGGISLKGAYQYSNASTQPVPTIKNQIVQFINNTFYGGLSFRF